MVLVAEDDFMVALDLKAMLESIGYSVLGPAGTVDDALRLLAQDEPDPAVLDVNLNGHFVIPVAKRLRGLQIPFVLVSACNWFDFEESDVLAEVEDVPKNLHRAPASRRRGTAQGAGIERVRRRGPASRTGFYYDLPNESLVV